MHCLIYKSTKKLGHESVGLKSEVVCGSWGCKYNMCLESVSISVSKVLE